MRKRMRYLMLTSILALGMAGLGSAVAGDGSHAHSGSAELHKVMAEGMKASHGMKMTGNVDKDFTTMMIAHHEQAIAMARIELAQGANAELKAMAQKMIDAQQKEISDLKRFK